MKKRFKSLNYNYIFDDNNGLFIRWGKNIEDDPDYSPFGPEIADIEVTTKCSGPDGRLCKFCYKGNTPKGENMSFKTFKNIFDKLPNTLTQIAFGADATCTTNPDIWKMFDYCRENKIIPNITVADVNQFIASKLAKVCGAVAVSRYDNKELCYRTIENLHFAGLKQINIHLMLSEETFNNAMDTIYDYFHDYRLGYIKAIVFLSLKQKGRGKKYTPLAEDKFKKLVNIALELDVPIGFDSCSSNKFFRNIANKEKYAQIIEPCESTCFSIYIDVHGRCFPCSFTPGCHDWFEGIKISTSKNFITDIWYSNKIKKFRSILVKNKDENGIKQCPLYSNI